MLKKCRHACGVRCTRSFGQALQSLPHTTVEDRAGWNGTRMRMPVTGRSRRFSACWTACTTHTLPRRMVRDMQPLPRARLQRVRACVRVCMCQRAHVRVCGCEGKGGNITDECLADVLARSGMLAGQKSLGTRLMMALGAWSPRAPTGDSAMQRLAPPFHFPSSPAPATDQPPCSPFPPTSLAVRAADGKEADVRPLVAAQRAKLLAGTTLLLSRIVPLGSRQPEAHPLWQLAAACGAACTLEPGSDVTHVVAPDWTQKVQWAAEHGIPAVTPAWVVNTGSGVADGVGKGMLGSCGWVLGQHFKVAVTSRLCPGDVRIADGSAAIRFPSLLFPPSPKKKIHVPTHTLPAGGWKRAREAEFPVPKPGDESGNGGGAASAKPPGPNPAPALDPEEERRRAVSAAGGGQGHAAGT